MSFDSTITEDDLDATTRQRLRQLRDEREFEPDLAVDGLRDSFFSRVVRLLTFGRS